MIVKNLIPGYLLIKLRAVKTEYLKTKLLIKISSFPMIKKFLVTFLNFFPDSTWAHEKILNHFYANRKNFKDPMNEWKQFLFHFHKNYNLRPQSIFDWRISVYFAYLTQQDFKGMLKVMSLYLETQKKEADNRQLDQIGICISSQNMFDSYNVHAYLDTHIKARILGLQPNLKIVLLLKSDDKIANPVMLEYWKKYISVISCDETIRLLSPLKPYLEQDLSFTAQVNGHPVYIEHAKAIVQKEWEIAGRKPLFEITSEDREFGWEQLVKLGIPRGAWFVSLHVRDPGYKMGSHQAEDSFDSYRNANIDNYFKAIKSIVARGGYVVRVGDPNMKNIPSMDGVFDYAHSNIRSNRMDVFLFSQCRFFVGVSSGPILNPILFGVPTVMTNFMPITGRPHASNCLYIPKLLWLNDHRRYVAFPEILSTDLGRIFTSHGYAEKNIKIIENSPEDLNDVVVEMMDVLESRLDYSVADNELQEKLNKLYRKYSGYGDMGRIGRAFIRKYSEDGLL